ncbi:MAG: hypothetical protein KGM24_15170 [Elusimicrobia bacterium]|nr:hypothetical protein [Elusimicrobiota bacterium]
MKPSARAVLLPVLAAALAACATTASVVVSSSYDPARVRTVALEGFADYPGAPGTGEIAAAAFEKYLLAAGYRVVDASGASGADAVVSGAVTAYSPPGAQTVMVDVPQEQTDPVYGRVISTTRSKDTRTTTISNVVTGYATTTTSQWVPSVQAVPANFGLSARLVDASGEVLWSATASAQGEDESAAADEASREAMDAVSARLKESAEDRRAPAR